MKNTKTLYWIFTAPFAALMIFSSIPDILSSTDAVTFMNHLGYPNYFIPFIGVAKLLGVVAILIPGFPKIKEWAYAGLAFDLIGAAFSITATDGFQSGIFFIIAVLVFCALSYIYYHKKLLSK
jgi:uncharacterized membrane protein YphA (DoxX/SURF4 family)